MSDHFIIWLLFPTETPSAISSPFLGEDDLNSDCNGNDISLRGTSTAHTITVFPVVPVTHKFKDRRDENKEAGHVKYSIFIYATCTSDSLHSSKDKLSLLVLSSYPLYPIAPKSRAGKRSEAERLPGKMFRMTLSLVSPAQLMNCSLFYSYLTVKSHMEM